MKLKLKFKAGSFVNAFSIIPYLQITYSPYYPFEKSYAIELGWGKWGIGIKFSFGKSNNI